MQAFSLQTLIKQLDAEFTREHSSSFKEGKAGGAGGRGLAMRTSWPCLGIPSERTCSLSERRPLS